MRAEEIEAYTCQKQRASSFSGMSLSFHFYYQPCRIACYEDWDFESQKIVCGRSCAFLAILFKFCKGRTAKSQNWDLIKRWSKNVYVRAQRVLIQNSYFRHSTPCKCNNGVFFIKEVLRDRLLTKKSTQLCFSASWHTRTTLWYKSDMMLVLIMFLYLNTYVKQICLHVIIKTWGNP